RPLLFPVRLATRLAADTPYLRNALNRLRPTPPLPYRPMPIGWMRAQLAPFGKVSLICHGIASRWQCQHVSEHTPGPIAVECAVPGRAGLCRPDRAPRLPRADRLPQTLRPAFAELGQTPPSSCSVAISAPP